MLVSRQDSADDGALHTVGPGACFGDHFTLIVARTNTFLFLFVLVSVCGEIVENASQITSARSQPDIAKLAAMVLNAYDAAILWAAETS